MKNILLILFLLFSITAAHAQGSDFLVLKKHDRTIKSFFAGTYISFSTGLATYYGLITSIRKDSVFISQYDVRQMPTNLGVYVLDTVAIYHLAFNYKNIVRLGNIRKGFDWYTSGAALFGGGVLLTAVGLGTWVFTKPNTRYHASAGLVGVSAALAAAGYFILKSNGKGTTIGKKYSLQYVKVK